MSTFPDRRENLYRASFPGCELRTAGDGPPTLTGHFAVFDQWTEINSSWEGNFLERISPGAFRKTFKENRDKIRVLFQHGKDPQIGDKPLGPVGDLREDATGAYYEVPLLDTSYNRDLAAGLEAGVYGASFRFRVNMEHVEKQPEKSAVNPDGIPERTVREAQVMEFGPVTFPAYAGATAGVRSITDLIIDVDAMTAATPILLDQERLTRAQIFVSRGLPVDERKDYSTDERKQLAKEGKALPDGSFPIVTVADLENAISAFGRASDPGAAKAHIKKRAAALGRTDLLPDDWSANSAEPDEADEERADSDAIIEEQDAPPVAKAERAAAHLRREGRDKTTTKWWIPSDQREVPKSWQ